MHALISLPPLCFSMFLPGQMGQIITLLSGVSGFFMIYIVPVFAYLKIKKLEIEYPLLAAALRQNEVKFFLPGMRPSDLPARSSFNDEREITQVPEETDNPPMTKHQAYEEQYNMSMDRMTASPKVVVSRRFLKRMNSRSPMSQRRATTNDNSPSFTQEPSASTNMQTQQGVEKSPLMIQNRSAATSEKSEASAQTERNSMIEQRARLLLGHQQSEPSNRARTRQRNAFKWTYARHMVIPLYGVIVLGVVLYQWGQSLTS